jgi:transcription elongation GreA/GreB family factor
MAKKTKKKVRKRAPNIRERIAKLERRVSELYALMPAGTDRQQGAYTREIRELQEQLRIERIHAVSKFSQVSTYKVSGSFGSGKQ